MPDLFNGYKTYIAAAGLAYLAWQQYSQGNSAAAQQSLCAALAAAGLRHAIQKTGPTPPPAVTPPATGT